MLSMLSRLKSAILVGADVFNDVVGGPQPFTRSTQRDPAFTGGDDMARRDAIAAAAEAELAGFVSDGSFFCQTPNDLGDACIWQGMYTAMTALRFRLKDTPENRKALSDATWALSRYFYPTGPGEAILVRGAVPQALEHKFFHVDPNNGAHYFTDAMGGQTTYVYRDDASLDSLLGAMFGVAMVRRFGTIGARATLELPVGRFSHSFAKSGYRLTNRDGSFTRYGDCSLGFAQAPVRILAAALPSLVSGDSNWKDIARAYGPEFSTTDTQVPGRISYVNAHLAMLANLTFLAAAPAGAPGYEHARAGVRRLLDKYADTGNSFLVYAAALLGVSPTQSQKDKAEKVLLEFPIGPKPKAGLNSSTAPALQPVPVWQRPPCDYIWQRSPYPYAGSESHAYNRLDYLIAHYLQRSL